MDKSMLKDVLFKEIDLIQGCINRMAANSFEIKKWTVGLLAIVAGLFKANKSKSIGECLIFIMIIFVFWYLDAFFLKTERLYRKKYSWLIEKRPKENLEYLFNLNPYEKGMMLVENVSTKNKKECNLRSFLPEIINVMFSKTLAPFYMGLGIFCVLVYVFS